VGPGFDKRGERRGEGKGKEGRGGKKKRREGKGRERNVLSVFLLLLAIMVNYTFVTLQPPQIHHENVNKMKMKHPMEVSI
jgi:hypothetical protein